MKINLAKSCGACHSVWMLHFTIKTAVWLQIPLSTSGPGLDADLADKTHHGRKGFLASCELHHVSQKTT